MPRWGEKLEAYALQLSLANLRKQSPSLPTHQEKKSEAPDNKGQKCPAPCLQCAKPASWAWKGCKMVRLAG